MLTICLALMAGFLTKHFVMDFPLQTQYQCQNKGKFGHPGGLLHSALHVVGTWIVILLALHWLNLTLIEFFLIGLVEFVVHYIIDWTKMNVNNYYKLTPSQDKYWSLLGLDQYLHSITYILITFYLLYNSSL
jgi:uncharacterized membrane protein YesL